MKKLLISVCASSGFLGVGALLVYALKEYSFATPMTGIFILTTTLFYTILNGIDRTETMIHKREESYEVTD